MKTIDVVGAALVQDGKILAAKRGDHGTLPGLWEFPGGKIEHGETPEHALNRELREELKCDARIGRLVAHTTHQYDFATINLAVYLAYSTDFPVLTEHSEVRWLKPSELASVEWAPADLPAVEALRDSNEHTEER